MKNSTHTPHFDLDKTMLMVGLAMNAGQLYYAVKAAQSPAPLTFTIEVKTKGDATVKAKIH